MSLDDISKPLFILFRKSLDEGSVPKDWEKANVSPGNKKWLHRYN